MRLFSIFVLSVYLLGGTFAAAQDPVGAVTVELNRADPVEAACRLTFMAQNGLPDDLETLSLETVLIDTSGQVILLTLFDFGALPVSTPRVRQFDVPALACDNIARVLINGVAACGPAEGCEKALTYKTRTEIEVIG